MALMTTNLLMPSIVTTYLFVCVLAAGGMLTVAADLWRSHTTWASRLALAVVGCVLGWLLAVICSLLSPTASLALFWHETVRFVFVVLLPPLIVLYFACYFGVPRLSWHVLVGVGFIPVLTVLFDLTNGLHHWFLASYTMQRVGPYFVRAAWISGPWFPIYSSFAVVSVLVTSVLLILTYRQRPTLFRAQVWVLVFALLPPAVLIMFDTFNQSPLALLDLSPLGFAATALLLTWGLRHERVLDLMPMAREAIFAGMADPVIVLDARGRVIDLNPAAERVLGRGANTVLGTEADKLLGQRLADLHAPPISAAVPRRASDLTTLDLECDGQTHRFDVRFSAFGPRSGRVDGHLLVLRDVTALKQAEEHLAEQAGELEAIFEAKADGVAVFDLQGHFVRANSALRHLLGCDADAQYTPRALDELAHRLQFFDEHGQQLSAEQWPHWRVLQGEVLAGASTMEGRVRTVDGRERWISTTGARVCRPDGQVTGTVLTTRDVTTRRHLEQQVAEQASRLEAIFEAMADGVLVHDTHGTILHANQAHRQLIGVEADPGFYTRALSDRVQRLRSSDEQGHPVPAENSASRRVLRGEVLKGPSAVDVLMHTLDGRELWVSISGAPMRGRDGQITGAVLLARDVTARRALERQIHEQASQLEAIFEALADGLCAFDSQGHLMRTNPAYRRLFAGREDWEQDRDDADFLSLSLEDRSSLLRVRHPNGRLMTPDEWPEARVLLGELGPTSAPMDTVITTLAGCELTLSISGAPITDAAGHVVGGVMLSRDVTEQRRLQAALAAQEQQYRTLVENSPDLIVRYDATLRPIYVSPHAAAVLGITADVRLGKSFAELGWSDELYGPWEQALREVFASGEPCTFDITSPFGIGGGDEQIYYYRVRYIPEFGGDGRVESVLGIATDITELQCTAEALRQSEERFSKAFHASPVPMAILSRRDRRFRDVNMAHSLLTGYARSELLGHRWADFRALAPTRPDMQQATFQEKGRFEAPIRLCTKFGAIRSCLMSTVFIRVGYEDCMIVTLRDVTERERAEEALRRQEQLFRTLVENTPDIIARFDRDLRYLYVNPAITRVAPIPPEQFVGKTNAELGWSESADGPTNRAIEQVLATGQSRTVFVEETTWRGTQDVRYFRAQILPEFAADGTVESVLSLTTEVTDLKRAEAALREANVRLETARQEEERRKRIAESLRGVLGHLNSSRSPQEALQYIVRQMEELLGNSAAAIYASDHFMDSMTPGMLATALRVQASEGLRIGGRRPRPRQRLPFIDAAVQHVLESAQPVALGGGDLVGRASHDGTNENSGILRLDGALPLPYQSLLVVPVRVHDEIHGCLLLFYRDPRRFLDEEVALAQAYADQVALAITNARLQAHREKEAAAAERNRLAQELHDTVTQEIFSGSIIAESLPTLWQTHRAEAEAGLKELHGLMKSAQAGLRALLLELRPGELEHAPLADALRRLGMAMTTRAGVPITVDVDIDGEGNIGSVPSLPAAVKVAFYRVAQEALMNAAKYANAHTIRLQLRSKGTPGKSRLELTVADDGIGFDPTAVPAEHFGLAIMRERAQSIGASVRIHSQTGQGTVAILTWRSSRNAVAPERAEPQQHVSPARGSAGGTAEGSA